MSTQPIRSGSASFGQEQLWLVEQAMPGTAVNNTIRAWDLHGPLDVAALRASLNLLVARHEVLRTTLRPDPTGLRQYVAPVCPVPFVALEADTPDAAVDRIRELGIVPFDLADALMIRTVLVRVTDEHHVLGIVIHHSACDGESFLILMAELTSAYAAYLDGAPSALAPTGADYLSFAAQERGEWVAGEAQAKEWLERLRATAGEYASLATGGRRRLVGAARVRRAELPRAAFGRLLERAAAAGCTPNMALTALFAVALSRWTNHEKVIFSSPVGRRLDPRFHRSVGFFVNSLPILLDVGGNPTFDTLLERARRAVLEGIEYVHVPPAEVQSALVGSGRAFDPLHQVTLAVDRSGPARSLMAGVTVVERYIAPTRTMFGISVRVLLDGADGRVLMEYDPDAASDEMAARFLAHLDELVRAAGDARRVADLPRVPAADGDPIRRWGTGARHDPAPCLLERIATQVRDRSDAPAVRDPEQEVSYRALWAASGRLSWRLRERGVGPEDVVAVCQPRSARLLVTILGVLRAGAAFMPLDPRDPAERRELLLTRSGARALVVDGAVDVGGWAGRVLPVEELLGDPADGVLPDGHHGDAPPDERPDPDRLAYVINTSGSTGVPKGVMITHGGLANYLRWAVDEYGIGPGGTVPLHTSVAFDLAVTSLFGPLYVGACVHVLPERLGPLAVIEHLHDGYRMVKGTPSHLLGALEAAVSNGVGRPPDVLVFGGENWPVEHVRRWLARMPEALLVNEYGPTETVVGSTAFSLAGAPEGDRLPAGADFVPIGRPIRNTTVYVVDDNLAPVPVGIRGELVIGGAGVARGYRNAPALTAERFMPDPFDLSGGGRLYRTGDLAFWNADGELELVGRVDDQVKILGYRVEPGEIEGALARFPGVQHAAVVVDRAPGRPVQLVAFVAPAEGAPASLAEEARKHLRRRLPPHMVPNTFVVLDRMPLNANGKVDRAALVPPPPSAGPSDPGAPPAPHSAQPVAPDHWRDVIHETWCTLLGRDSVPVDLSFFEAGGNSLMLLKLDALLRDRGVVGLTVTDLFRFPTIDSLAERVRTTRSSRTGPPAGDSTAAAGPALVRRERPHRVRS